jgi:hypothetical protein
VYGPNVADQQGWDVVVAGHTIRFEAGSYQVTEAPRFGQKINIGSLKYADFNPYDSAHAIAVLSGGYGLQAYSDLPDGDIAATMFESCDGIDTRGTPTTLAPKHVAETLPDVDGPPVWGGEFLGEYVVVAGTQVFTRASDGTWTNVGITLNSPAVEGAVGVFNGHLIFGEGASDTAEYTDDLALTGNVENAEGPIFVFAFTADGAAAYVAGGRLTTDVNLLITSADGILYDSTTATTCGTKDDPITGLSPGGGLVIVYIGKETEVGCVDQGGTYRILVPFDSALSTNCQVFRQQLGAGGNEQRGPISLFFSRDRATWNYQPSDQTAGAAANVSPWASPYLRPSNARGVTTAIQGSARWLYVAVEDADGGVWITVRDSRTGSWSSPYTLSGECHFIGITSLFDDQPLLLFGNDNEVHSVILPLDGDMPLDDANCRFELTGVLTTSDIDLGFPDEDKVAFSIRINHRNLSPTHRELRVDASFDGGAYVFIGTADGSGENPEFTDMNFPPDVVCKRVRLQITFTTDDDSETPELHGLTVRLSLNTTLRKLWTFNGMVPAGYHRFGQDLDNPHTTIADLWLARRSGFPVAFTDRWGDAYNVRILSLDEKEIYRGETLETNMHITLLEVGLGAAESLIFSAPLAAHTFIPITLGD